MKWIGLLSDTHGYLEPKIMEFFSNCDEIWHAGDIGNDVTADKLENLKPLRAVFGNIDGGSLRFRYKVFQVFQCEEVTVLMTHIGGYPGHYERGVIELINQYQPGIMISGHSHILKIMPDKKYNLLHLNPGAAGNSGFHHVKTALRFKIDKKDILEMEVFELQRK